MNCLFSYIQNRKYIFGKDCNKLKNIITVTMHDGYVSLQNIRRLLQPIIVDYTTQLQIKNKGEATNFTDKVNKVMTFVGRNDMIESPFTNYQKICLALGIMLTKFIQVSQGQANYFFKSHQHKVKNPFAFELPNFRSTCKIWARQLILD